MTQTAINPPKQYFNSIDGLRLLASINIVLFHIEKMGGFANLQGSPGWLFLLLKGPAFHASLFFILAGFIFTIKYTTHASTFSTSILLKGRFRDLYPLHAATLIIMIVLTILTAGGAIDLIALISSALVHGLLLFSMIPVNTYTFNQPSWALSAFFLCYLVFGPALRILVRIQRRRTIILLMMGCLMPSSAASLMHGIFPAIEVYQFLHIFAPIRVFEFFIGMLLARLYQCNTGRIRRFSVRKIPFLNDAIIVIMVAAIYLILQKRESYGSGMTFFSYHTLLLPIYACLLYRLAQGNGVIASLFAIPFIRNLGKCSFYPYLLHIPLASGLCFILEHYCGIHTFLHAPLNIVGFMVVLYGASYWYFAYKKKHKKKTYRPDSVKLTG